MTGGDLGRGIDGLFTLLKWFGIASTVLIPLGVWKLIEILLVVFV